MPFSAPAAVVINKGSPVIKSFAPSGFAIVPYNGPQSVLCDLVQKPLSGDESMGLLFTGHARAE